MRRPGTSSAAQSRSAGRAGRLALGLLWTAAVVLTVDAYESPPARATTAVATRFSSLAELTPRNVDRLLPLSPSSVAVGSSDNAAMAARGSGRAARLGSLAGDDERLKQFVSWRMALSAGPASPSGRSHGSAATVSLVAAPAAAAGQPGTFAAWDADQARMVWRAAGEPANANSGALVTAGGLILYCSAEGWFTVLDVATGRELWKHHLAGGERGIPISYLGPDGHQYVAVVTARRGHWATLQPFSLPH